MFDLGIRYMVIHCTIIFSFLFEIFPYKKFFKKLCWTYGWKAFRKKRDKVEKTSKEVKRPVFC